MTERTKDAVINVRVRPQVRLEFRAAAEMKGGTMSGLIHQFIVKTIREERESDPVAFAEIQERLRQEPDDDGGILLVPIEDHAKRMIIPVIGRANENDQPVQDHSVNQGALFSEPEPTKGKRKPSSRTKLLKKDEQDARAAARERLAQKRGK
jgi:hypothetical protein